jgi:hypothetical protein
MPLGHDQYEAVAARYLKALARNDMAAWRRRLMRTSHLPRSSPSSARSCADCAVSRT